MTSSIVSSRVVPAAPDVVHDLLCDVEAWALWSPHIASVDPPGGRAVAGWSGGVRAWFSPRPVEMIVDAAPPAGGLRWHSHALGHTLRYGNLVEASGSGSRVTFRAVVEGPAGGLLTALARPVSAFGQRRRLRRLDALARVVAPAGQRVTSSRRRRS